MRAREAGERRRGDDPLGARISAQWAQVALDRKGLQTKVIAYHSPDAEPPFVRIDPDGAGWRVTPAEGVELSVDGGERLPDGSARLAPGSGVGLYVDDGAVGRWWAGGPSGG